MTTLAYVRRGGDTLMLRRGANHVGPGKWNGLGGKLEPGETPEACMIREVAEESGLVVESYQYRGLLTFPSLYDEVDVYVFVYLVTDFSGQLAPSDEGDLFWIPSNQLISLELWEGDKHFLPWLDQPGVFSASFEYRDGRYVSHTVEWPTGGEARGRG